MPYPGNLLPGDPSGTRVPAATHRGFLYFSRLTRCNVVTPRASLCVEWNDKPTHSTHGVFRTAPMRLAVFLSSFDDEVNCDPAQHSDSDNAI